MLTANAPLLLMGILLAGSTCSLPSAWYSQVVSVAGCPLQYQAEHGGISHAQVALSRSPTF